MKKHKILLPLFAAFFALICAIVLLTFSVGAKKAYAGAYDFGITRYDVEYDVKADRTMSVTEITEIEFRGYASTGHVHLIPVNAGDRVRNLKVSEIVNGKEVDVDYSVTDEYSGFIGADIGDYSVKTDETHTYKLTYEYAITQPTKENAIFINPIGFGWSCAISDVSVKLHLPEGFLNDKTDFYIGKTSVSTPDEYTYDAGTNTITANVDYLARGNGLTFNLYFGDGVLSTKQDLSPLWVVLAGCALLAVILIVKLLRFNKNDLTPVVNFDALIPNDGDEETDPLAMGKLIDNKVDNSDVTSMIYYWANKGYLKIKFDKDDDSDATLIRIWRALPDDVPNYQKVMYAGLFGDNDTVTIKSLAYKFYSTVEKVTKEVNAEAGRLYSSGSMSVAILFAVIAAAVMCLTPILVAMFTINVRLFIIIPVFMVVPAFLIFAITQSVRYRTHKMKKHSLRLAYFLTALLCAGVAALYAYLIVPSFVMEFVTSFLLGLICLWAVMLSAFIISRTDSYTKKLNGILGLKSFITEVEKDKLEAMLEGNPELYYNVLPYAIVLGVSDLWSDKFEALTVAPPQWATGNFDVFDFIIFNRLMRSVNVNMAKAFISRAASSGLSGGGFHGSFGGGGGFGHGGGGGFGR